MNKKLKHVLNVGRMKNIKLQTVVENMHVPNAIHINEI